MTDYRLGFTTLEREVVVGRLPVDGEIPSWLAGTLVRNGPAIFEHSGRSLRHWFDGQSMLHRFVIDGGSVGYANRLLDTPSLRRLREGHRIGYAEFATDPCGSLFGRFFTRFSRKPSANANVNISQIAGRPVAVTEVPLAVEFDLDTLATLGVTAYDGGVGGALTTAHPHAVPGGDDHVNYVLRFGRASEYVVYRRAAGDRTGAEVARWATDRPGYVHSFAVTARYAVLAVFPLVVNPLSLLLSGRPFIENYRWRPELGLRIVVIDLDRGGVHSVHEAPPVFAFHHINAYDEGDRIVMDLCAFPDADIIGALYLDPLRAGLPVPMARPVRYEIPLAGAASGVRVRQISDQPLELPRINYVAHNGRPYRYAYGVGASDPTGRTFLDRLTKVDVHTGTMRSWQVDGCYPGEPVFVAAPAAAAEDDGVLLSVVLDARAAASSLLVLDARSMRELGRAHAPLAIPFGFHGQFTRRVDPGPPQMEA